MHINFYLFFFFFCFCFWIGYFLYLHFKYFPLSRSPLWNPKTPSPPHLPLWGCSSTHPPTHSHPPTLAPNNGVLNILRPKSLFRTDVHKAIFCHIYEQHHGLLHVYSLIGGPVTGSTGSSNSVWPVDTIAPSMGLLLFCRNWNCKNWLQLPARRSLSSRETL